MNIDYKKYYNIAFELYKQLHKTPEVGFELNNTIIIVKKELNDCGISFTEKYGKGSIVAEVGKGERCIALRADMDALPIEENSGLEYSSEIKGSMHACGHDSHTAILLAVARCLKDIEDDLNLRVRFIFQPSEEGAISGAKMLVDNDVMHGVEQIIATHCEASLNAFDIGVCKGEYMAACVPISIVFYGKSSHATIPEQGVDAIAMANRAYVELEKAVKEEAHNHKYVWSVGRFVGGTTHNIICDKCQMEISFRFYDMNFANRMQERCLNICNAIAKEYGGKVDVIWDMSTGPVINYSKIVEKIKTVAKLNDLTVKTIQSRMSSEDFGWYLTKVPGCLFRYGIYSKEYGSGSAAHTCNFKIYPPAMEAAIKVFVEYVLNINEENKK